MVGRSDGQGQQETEQEQQGELMQGSGKGFKGGNTPDDKKEVITSDQGGVDKCVTGKHVGVDVVGGEGIQG